MVSSEDSKKHNRLASLISAACRYQLAYLSRELSRFELGSGSYMYLMTIVENPGITQAHLAREFMIDRATVSKMLDFLEEKKMIRRKPHPTDRRAVTLEATKAGRETYDAALSIIEEYHRTMLQGVSLKEEEAVILGLHKIVENIKGSQT